MTVRARLLMYDAVQANNKAEYPDMRLPTYEGIDEWQVGDLHVNHVCRPERGIDFVQYTVNGQEVDPKTITSLVNKAARCPRCNFPITDDDAKFCNECGQDLRVPFELVQRLAPDSDGSVGGYRSQP